MKLSLKSKVRQSDRIISHQFGNTVYILDPNKNTIRVLNNSAGVIWNLAKNWRRVDSVITELTKIFEVAPSQAETDARRYLSKFIRMDYIKVRSTLPAARPAGGYTDR